MSHGWLCIFPKLCTNESKGNISDLWVSCLYNLTKKFDCFINITENQKQRVNIWNNKKYVEMNNSKGHWLV